MRDKTHLEQIERWARFFKENPKLAKIEANKLTDAQILKSREFYERLKEMGLDNKIAELRNLRVCESKD